MKNKTFDFEGFYSKLDWIRTGADLTWKELASYAGVTASTLTRMGQGKHPSVTTLAALSRWSEISIDQFVLSDESTLMMDENEDDRTIADLRRPMATLDPEG